MGRSLTASIVKSRQSGYVSSALSSGTGEDSTYVDVAIAAVDPNKCLVVVTGGAGDTGSRALYDVNSQGQAYKILARLTSATNLRISSHGSANGIVARWQVIEFR